MPIKKPSILLVEDQDVLLRSLVQILFSKGYRIRSAGDGWSALAQLRIEIPDLILSDLQMPGMSGFELLSVVRRVLPAIPVIAMSGSFSGNTVPSGVAADAFYPKGTNLAYLVQLVESLTPDTSSSRFCFDVLCKNRSSELSASPHA